MSRLEARQNEIDAIKKRVDSEYADFVEYYEDDEDRTNTYKAAHEQAMKDVRYLLQLRIDE